MRTKMPKIKIVKTTVCDCEICDLDSYITNQMNKERETATTMFPDKSLKPSWDSWLTSEHGVPGYSITFLRPITKEEEKYYWQVKDGIIEVKTRQICEECYKTLFKCLDKIGEAEEIGFATKESYKHIPAVHPSEYINEEETEE